MSMRVDSNQLIAGRCVVTQYPGHGIQAQNVPATGGNGAGYLYNDIAEYSFAATDEMRGQILTLPAAGTFTPYEDSSFSFTGAPDGVYTFTYRGFRNGVTYGDYTVTMTIGSQPATVAFTMPQMTVAVSATVSAPGNSASVSFAMPQMSVAVSASQSPPGVAATILATMPQMQVACSADIQPVGVTANIAFTMPQMAVSVAASSAAPVISATISFAMPQMSVYVLSGEFDYYNGAGSIIETLAASTHIEYTL